MKKVILSIFALVLCASAAFAQAERVRLYEGKAPGSEKWTQQEFLFDYTTSMYPGEVGQCMLNVVDPELYVYLPAKGTETGAAVVVCPGGGFTALSWSQEGPNVAKWLAAHGIAAFVLKYRIAYSGADYEEAKYIADHSYGNQGRTERFKELSDKHAEIAKEQGYDRKMSCDDGRVAIAYLRKNAEKYNINPNAIGIIGFSAGGHIVWDVALHHDTDSRPDFAGLIYPAWFTAEVPSDPMPLFIAASQGEAASTNNFGDTPALYTAWNKTRQPAEIHSFTNAFHGFGYRENGKAVNIWTTLFY
ncbi:MAG: alpha/beta hydrolase, partial [Bacteroidales bacterium]|nr:alpha/beta hydrolase [Bacteroidales bacterium]